jgi:hypothetical protein
MLSNPINALSMLRVESERKETRRRLLEGALFHWGAFARMAGDARAAARAALARAAEERWRRQETELQERREVAALFEQAKNDVDTAEAADAQVEAETMAVAPTAAHPPASPHHHQQPARLSNGRVRLSQARAMLEVATTPFPSLRLSLSSPRRLMCGC